MTLPESTETNCIRGLSHFKQFRSESNEIPCYAWIYFVAGLVIGSKCNLDRSGGVGFAIL